MVPILARQAVIIKCLAGNGILISNYECAYGIGLLYCLSGMPAPEWGEETVAELLTASLSAHESVSFTEEPARRLLTMLRAYKPDETRDKQAEELYRMGATEQQLWKKSNTPPQATGHQT